MGVVTDDADRADDIARTALADIIDFDTPTDTWSAADNRFIII